MVNQMIAVGEATGALDNMLNKIADFYDDEVDAAVATLTSMLEPMLMIFLGTTVGFVIVAMYMPIFQMGSHRRKIISRDPRVLKRGILWHV